VASNSEWRRFEKIKHMNDSKTTGWFPNPHQPGAWLYSGPFPPPEQPPAMKRDMDPQAELMRLRGLVRFFADQVGMGPAELMKRHGV